MLAALDLGSNSFHLLIAEKTAQGYSVVEKFSRKVQLGEGVYIDRHITDAAMQRGLDCLSSFQEAIARYPVSRVRVIGTQTLRYAENAPVFLREARAVGFDIEVISGEREAELVYRGVNRIIEDWSLPRFIVDIGGGSTEISVGSGEEADVTTSTVMGCVSWRDAFFSNGEISESRLLDAVEAAKSALTENAEKIRRYSWQQAFASSGSAKMLEAVLKENNITDGVITAAGLAFIERAALQAGNVDSFELAGLKPQRQNLIVPGLCIMRAVVEVFGLDKVTYSSAALREGLLDCPGFDD